MIFLKDRPSMITKVARVSEFAAASELTPRERQKIVNEAAKIIDEHRRDNPGEHGGTKASCANMLDWLEYVDHVQRVFRLHRSAEFIRREKKIAAWLREGVALLNTQFAWPLGFEEFSAATKRWSDIYEAEEKRRLPGKPKRSAYKKTAAAETALHLCDEFDLKTKTTKNGVFCTLAAVLYGDRDADLQKHCIAVLAPNYRTSLARRKTTQK